MAEAVTRSGMVVPSHGHTRHSWRFGGNERSRLLVSCRPYSGPKVEEMKIDHSRQGLDLRSSRNVKTSSSPPKLRGCIGKSMKWWEKSLQPNIKEIESAQDLVDSLLNAGDKLVIVDFFSPGCGGCKALHPKICQFAEMNPDVIFLQVNHEIHKSMCYTLHIHVLPFFRFYRGAEGRLCSFSCTNATIKKFKDALAKHTPERSSIGPPRGLDESELSALAANKDLSFVYPKKIVLVPSYPTAVTTQRSGDKTLVSSGR